jgi:hypothetical protein
MLAGLSRAKQTQPGAPRAEGRPTPNIERDALVSDPQKLRQLACWYRAFAERIGNPTIWDSRLRTAEDLEAEAARIESGKTSRMGAGGAD